VIDFFLRGLGLGFALILAIGAQNAFVMRQGILRQNRFLVALVSALGDTMLIAVGAIGLGYIITRLPAFVILARWAGTLFLLTYGLSALWRSRKRRHLDVSALQSSQSAGAILAMAVGFSLLNPHAWLDTSVVIGGIAVTLPLPARWFYIAGAIAASFLWFFALAFGSSLLGPVFRRERAWQVFDMAVGIIMVTNAWLVWRG
jgi:L-lysine exporter family protein LysE/ArgO